MKPRAEAGVLVQPEVEARAPPFKSSYTDLGLYPIALGCHRAVSNRPAGARARWHSRGPHGANATRITANDILRAARTADELLGQSLSCSVL
jgi:hypothetical protein